MGGKGNVPMPLIFRHDRGWETGQAFVELALVLPIFTVLVLGAVEFGRLAYAAIEVGNAARAGVSYAAQNHTTAQDTANIQLAATNEAPEIANLTATPSYSCSCESTTGAMTTPGSCATINLTAGSCPSPSRIVLFVQVNTSATVNTVFHFTGFPNSVTLTGKAIMRAEQ
jgi:Flp pilus assembly protein TadG